MLCKEEKVGDRVAEGILLHYLSNLGPSLEGKRLLMVSSSQKTPFLEMHGDGEILHANHLSRVIRYWQDTEYYSHT